MFKIGTIVIIRITLFLQNLCFDNGLDKLEIEFRKQLREHSSKPISPAILQKVAQAETAEDVPELKHIPGNNSTVAFEILLIWYSRFR